MPTTVLRRPKRGYEGRMFPGWESLLAMASRIIKRQAKVVGVADWDSKSWPGGPQASNQIPQKRSPNRILVLLQTSHLISSQRACDGISVSKSLLFPLMCPSTSFPLAHVKCSLTCLQQLHFQQHAATTRRRKSHEGTTDCVSDNMLCLPHFHEHHPDSWDMAHVTW